MQRGADPSGRAVPGGTPGSTPLFPTTIAAPEPEPIPGLMAMEFPFCVTLSGWPEWSWEDIKAIGWSH